MAIDAARAKSLFLKASDLADPAERAAYLERECGGDAELRGRVEALLRANDAAPLPPAEESGATVDSQPQPGLPERTGEYTPQPDDAPPNLVPTTDYRPNLEPGLVIAGRYTLVQKIGEGGMGEVWVAKQTEPVKRKVALKLIKTGMDSKAVLARFEQERQALALMDHPNNARVLDGGMTPTGQPFFVMEVVNGLPLNKFCDEMKLTPRERLELFVPICQAVQHAHQKGIVHRDLKPANILVTLIDGKPVPKVIDFGVAKATAGKLTDESMSTQFGAIVGTLEYMSPEQAGFSGEDIDTRADIYSLGVILYELLTGLKPIDAKRLRKAALTEMIRIIREEEPSKPSTRLSTDESLPSLAVLRQIEPKKLIALLRGELDWVVMKCLEKQRERRYETANGLARDIQRYLADEVVEARPPSANYWLQKFVRRHKVQVIAASLVLLTLVGGVVGTTIGLLEANAAAQKERDANTAAQAARTAAENAAEAAKAAKIEAQRQQVRAEWLLYASKITLAQRELEADNVDAAAAVLKSTRPDFRSWEYDYLQTQFESNKIVCKAPSIDAISRDGKRLASSDYRLGRWGVTVWDMETGKLLVSLKHSGPVRALAFNADGTRLACGGDIANKHDKPADLKVWDLETGKVIFELEGHVPGVAGVCYSPDGKRISSLAGNLYGKSAELKVWDAQTGKEVLNLQGPAVAGRLGTGDVGGLAYSPDGKRIAAGMAQLLNVWDAETGKVVLSFRAHQYVVTSLAYSPDGKRIATTSPESNMKLWDAETGKELLGIPNDGGEGIAFSPDGKRIASRNGQLVKVWDALTGKEVRSIKTGASAGLAFILDGKRLAIAAGGTVGTWEIDKRQGDLTFEAGKAGLSSMALSPDGQRIATASALLDPTVKIWDTQTGKLVFILKGHGDFVSSLAFSRDGKTLASASRDGTTRIWDMNAGENKRTLKSGFRERGVVALGPNGDLLATNEDDKTVTIWDLKSGKPTFALPAATECVLSLAFSSDGKYLASGSSGVRDNLKVWNVQTGQLAFTRQGQNVFSVAFSPDGRYLASAGIEETIRVWNSKTGDESFVLRGHMGSIESVTFSPDGKRIATASADGTIKLWEAQRGFETITLPALHEPQRAVAFNSNGQRLACAGQHGTVRIWDAGLR
jgi:WD40 repeat protein/serine/threonine protein kinase/gas vesicle protein